MGLRPVQLPGGGGLQARGRPPADRARAAGAGERRPRPRGGQALGAAAQLGARRARRHAPHGLGRQAARPPGRGEPADVGGRLPGLGRAGDGTARDAADPPAAARRPRQLGPLRRLLAAGPAPRPAPRLRPRPGGRAQRAARRAPCRLPADLLRLRDAPGTGRLRRVAVEHAPALRRGRHRARAGRRARRRRGAPRPGHAAARRQRRPRPRRPPAPRGVDGAGVVRRRAARRARGGRARRRPVAAGGRAADLVGDAGPAHPSGRARGPAPARRGVGPRGPRGRPRRPGRGVPPAPAAPRAGRLLRRVGRGARDGAAPARAHRHLGRGRRGDPGVVVALPGRRRRPRLRPRRDPRAARRTAPRTRRPRCWPRWSWTTTRRTGCATATVARAGWSRGRRSPTARRSPSPTTCCPVWRRPVRSSSRRSAAGPTTAPPPAPRSSASPAARGRLGRRLRRRRAHGLARPRGRRSASTGSSWRSPHLLEALDPRPGPGGDAQRRAHRGSTGPSSPTSPSWSAPPRELHEQPRDGVRVAHHDLGLWDELAEVGIVDAQAEQWVRAARALRGLGSAAGRGPGRGGGRAAALPARGLPLARVPVAGRARRDPRRRHGARQDPADPGARRARPRAGAGPFLVVAPTSVVVHLGPRGRAVHPRPGRPRGHRVPRPAGHVGRASWPRAPTW